MSCLISSVLVLAARTPREEAAPRARNNQLVVPRRLAGGDLADRGVDRGEGRGVIAEGCPTDVPDDLFLASGADAEDVGRAHLASPVAIIVGKSMNVEQAIEAAERLLPGAAAPEGDTDPRWQAMIRISEFIPTDPQPVWQFVSRWGCDPDKDLRMGVACCVLEHLLEDHFAFCFPVMSDLAGRDRLFATTVHSCWSTLSAEKNLQFQALREHLTSVWEQRLDDRSRSRRRASRYVPRRVRV